MRFDVITLFPQLVQDAVRWGVLGRALESGLLSLHTHNLFDYSQNRHRRVDARPYGGGAGMVLMAEPIGHAIEHVRQLAPASPVVHLSPRGRRLDQALARELSAESGLVLLCSRYEGVDQRVLDKSVDFEISIGDFILSGGDIAALALIDTLARLCPGVLGDARSSEQDSFTEGTLEHAHYTHPAEIWGMPVPAVLLSGDHAAIAHWRRRQALVCTAKMRPDLLEAAQLSESDQALLAEEAED